MFALAVAGGPGVGIPDDYRGEAVRAVVKKVDFVDELPTSACGTVLRREVRARYWSGDRSIAGDRSESR